MTSRHALARVLVAVACGCASAARPAAPPPPTPSAATPAPEVMPEALAGAPDGRKLVAQLARGPVSDGTAFERSRKLFDEIDALNDPRAADGLVSYAKTGPHAYLETRAALALAELGDLRAVPLLAKRLRTSPLEFYEEKHDFEQPLRQSDRERVSAARLLADLLRIHPEARAAIRAQAESATLAWVEDAPSPHDNALRVLALMKSEKGAALIRQWASPQESLPTEGAQPPLPQAFVVALSAQRYAGVLQDGASWDVLLHNLKRRPKDVDGTMNGATTNGTALLVMSLRALAGGAADGLSEWGDSRAFAPLLAYAEDPKNNEQSRLSACFALGWVGTDEALQKLAVRVSGVSLPPDDALLGPCLITAFRQRAIPGLSQLVFLFRVSQDLRPALVRAAAKSGLDARSEELLLKAAQVDDASRSDAALGLMLGGSSQAAEAAVKAFGNRPSATEQLRELWQNSFDFVARDDVKNGSLLRAVENAVAVSGVTLDGQPQSWALQLLGNQLRQLVYDNGPHSVTRTVLRHDLVALARGTEQRSAALAIRALELLEERGVLLALAEDGGATAVRAAAAYQRLVPPRP